MKVRGYLLSLPERLLRSTVAVGAGMLREVGEATLPPGVRRGRLYQNLVDTTLRYLIEEVGGAAGVYKTEEQLAEDFLLRRSAGNVLEVLGIVAFRASPVWVLAALADVCGAGRHLIPEIAEALKAEGLLDDDAQFTSVDQMLDGLERTSCRLAETVNAPPLDVPALRKEWMEIRQDARSIAPGGLPSRDTLASLWTQLKEESARQERSVFDISSALALSTVATVPERVRWLSASGRVAATRTGRVFAAALLDHYRQTLQEVRRAGFGTYATRQLGPYVRAAFAQFSPQRQTLTERLITWRNRPPR